MILWEYNRKELELTMTSIYGIYVKIKPSKTFEYIIDYHHGITKEEMKYQLNLDA